MAASLKRRLMRVGGWPVARRMVKSVPVAGALLAMGLAGHEIRRKGLLRGAVHVGLDVTPVVGAAKGLVELFTGDLIPDKRPEKDGLARKRLLRADSGRR